MIRRITNKDSVGFVSFIDAGFQATDSECDLAQHEVRCSLGWHHRVTVAALADAVLAALGALAKKN